MILRRLRSLRGRATLIMAFGMGLKLGIQILSFGLVAAFMGAIEFGRFATVVAVVGVIATFACWGGDQLLIRRVARDHREFPRALATAFAFLALAGTPLVVAAVGIAPVLVTEATALHLVLPVVVSDVVFANLNTLVVASYRAFDQPARATWSNLNFSGARLVAAIAWVLLAPNHDAVSWAGFYCAASAIAAVVGVPRLCRRLGMPVWDIAWREAREGFHFAAYQGSAVIYMNVDKPLVAILSNLSVAGTYAAAFRIAEAAALPLRALFYAVCPDFFRFGASGIHRNVKFALELLPVCLGSGLLGALGLVVIAPIAPALLGASYANTYVILLIFAARPMISAVENLGVDVLSTSGYTGSRALMTLALPLVKIGGCLALVPPYGAVGAAIAELVTLAFLLGASWAAIFVFTRKVKPDSPIAPPAAEAALKKQAV